MPPGSDHSRAGGPARLWRQSPGEGAAPRGILDLVAVPAWVRNARHAPDLPAGWATTLDQEKARIAEPIDR